MRETDAILRGTLRCSRGRIGVTPECVDDALAPRPRIEGGPTEQSARMPRERINRHFNGYPAAGRNRTISSSLILRMTGLPIRIRSALPLAAESTSYPVRDHFQHAEDGCIVDGRYRLVSAALSRVFLLRALRTIMVRLVRKPLRSSSVSALVVLCCLAHSCSHAESDDSGSDTRIEMDSVQAQVGFDPIHGSACQLALNFRDGAGLYTVDSIWTNVVEAGSAEPVLIYVDVSLDEPWSPDAAETVTIAFPGGPLDDGDYAAPFFSFERGERVGLLLLQRTEERAGYNSVGITSIFREVAPGLFDNGYLAPGGMSSTQWRALFEPIYLQFAEYSRDAREPIDVSLLDDCDRLGLDLRPDSWQDPRGNGTDQSQEVHD